MTDENGARLNYDGDISQPVATKEQVLTEIESLLNAGLTNLEQAGDNFSFTLSSGFSGFNTPETFAHFNRGLMARVSVLQDKWSQAQEALTSVDAWMNAVILMLVCFMCLALVLTMQITRCLRILMLQL